MWPFTTRRDGRAAPLEAANPARELALIGAEKRRKAALSNRARIHAVAIEIATKHGLHEQISTLKGLSK